jgi:hypothetical protein
MSARTKSPWCPLAGTLGGLVAIGNSALTIAWNLLADPQAHYSDLGLEYYHPRSTATGTHAP